MPGGPINGVPWTGMLSPAGGAGIASAAMRDTDPNDPANITGIIVPTVLQMSIDALNYWTSMTCLYDPYWEADPDKVTLPICMFHVKKITPTRTVEVSKKRVILYEPQQDNKIPVKTLADQMRRGVMRTIADNAVQQPVTYSVEAIVPFQPTGRYVTEGIKALSDTAVAISDLIGGEVSDKLADAWEGLFSTAFSMAKTAGQAAEFAGKLPGMNGVSYINMNSLEAMADSCRTLCMKMWTGYDYKYVMITGMTSDKQPAEDDVFRVSLTLQEIPVLAVTRPAPSVEKPKKLNWAAAAVGAAQTSFIQPLIQMTGVKEAAGNGIDGNAAAPEKTISAVLGG